MLTHLPTGRYPTIPHLVVVSQLLDLLYPYLKNVHGLHTCLENQKSVTRFLLHLCSLAGIALVAKWSLFLMLIQKVLTLLPKTALYSSNRRRAALFLPTEAVSWS